MVSAIFAISDYAGSWSAVVNDEIDEIFQVTVSKFTVFCW